LCSIWTLFSGVPFPSNWNFKSGCLASGLHQLGQVSYKPDRKIRNKSKRSPTKALSYWRESITHKFKGSSKTQRNASGMDPCVQEPILSVQYVRSEEPLNADNDNIDVQNSRLLKAKDCKTDGPLRMKTDLSVQVRKVRGAAECGQR
jgi:hypothetical protein